MHIPIVVYARKDAPAGAACCMEGTAALLETEAAVGKGALYVYTCVHWIDQSIR